jgi:hypothetical protein
MATNYPNLMKDILKENYSWTHYIKLQKAEDKGNQRKKITLK